MRLPSVNGSRMESGGGYGRGAAALGAEQGVPLHLKS